MRSQLIRKERTALSERQVEFQIRNIVKSNSSWKHLKHWKIRHKIWKRDDKLQSTEVTAGGINCIESMVLMPKRYRA